MGFFYQGLSVSTIIALLVLIALCVGLNEITRRSNAVSIAVYCVLPVILAVLIFTGVMGSPSGKTWFGWVKVVSALTGVYGFMLIRFTKLGEKKFAAIFPVAILSLNILEAVFKEFEVFGTIKTLTIDAAGITVLGGPWNILNAIAGVLCIVTLTGFVGIRASNDKSKDMIWPDMTWMYVIGYTLWNMSYVYNCISTRSLYAGFAILTAALIAEFCFKRGAWLQHRAQILSFFAMFSLAVDYQQAALFGVVATYSKSALMTLSIASLVFNLGVFAYMVYVVVKYKRNPIKQEIFTHTKYYKKTIESNLLG